MCRERAGGGAAITIGHDRRVQQCQVERNKTIWAATGLDAFKHALVIRGEVGRWVGHVVEAHGCGVFGPEQEQHVELDYRLQGTQGGCRGL